MVLAEVSSQVEDRRIVSSTSATQDSHLLRLGQPDAKAMEERPLSMCTPHCGADSPGAGHDRREAVGRSRFKLLWGVEWELAAI